jgi:hypothetical protein
MMMNISSFVPALLHGTSLSVIVCADFVLIVLSFPNAGPSKQIQDLYGP